jgi:hypothetical protein
MISYKNFNQWGRLGNWLFQYSFLRTTARRLGVKFYCPEWIGDHIFLLNDRNERAPEPENISKTYREPLTNCGFNETALKIGDNTDIMGCFQTEKYFDERLVREWFTFREDKISKVKEKYRYIDFSKSVSLHLRLTDMLNHPHYFIPSVKYYKKALSKVGYNKHILVFSDDIILAKSFLEKLVGNIVYLEGNMYYEDLYLMNLCHDFIASPSTFSWWGAWLNSYPDKVVLAPKEGPVRPGSPIANDDYWPREWIRIKALSWPRNNFKIMRLYYRIINKMRLLTRILSSRLL